ncbi:PPOX class probable F420-dependent enzyme [Allocatelliglobosispora scoriae]|uniref:PPOX class probable F420-dependent enzyme n=1 Tax=Allocatelliglobosispora scoriae TaxID=643052 RepID=A0A841C416_9ACTN|nr:PPOX class F420-dependent oxidoreductase [Allocatelliglobosispora scoriae]MBB5873883.1 PPOX class probable F420-dependent enzyme [Allocatelliglobosispora scoriae]
MSFSDEIRRSKQVNLTTFRKDGTGVATPVWHVVDGDELFIISEAEAWKVKRIRKNSRVLITACDIRGKVAPGAEPIEGRARLLDDAGTQAARKLVAQRYIMSRLGNWFSRVLHLRKAPVIGIAVTI